MKIDNTKKYVIDMLGASYGDHIRVLEALGELGIKWSGGEYPSSYTTCIPSTKYYALYGKTLYYNEKHILCTKHIEINHNLFNNRRTDKLNRILDIIPDEIIYEEDSSMLRWIKKMFNHSKEKKWYETYWFFDFHGVISVPDYRKESKEVIYYPYIKELLQILTKRDDIVMVLFTSSHPDEIKVYLETMKNDGIEFKYINENPEISEKNGAFGYYDRKPYYNVLFDDKAGWEPEGWEEILNYFINTRYQPKIEWKLNNEES